MYECVENTNSTFPLDQLESQPQPQPQPRPHSQPATHKYHLDLVAHTQALLATSRLASEAVSAASLALASESANNATLGLTLSPTARHPLPAGDISSNAASWPTPPVPSLSTFNTTDYSALATHAVQIAPSPLSLSLAISCATPPRDADADEISSASASTADEFLASPIGAVIWTLSPPFLPYPQQEDSKASLGIAGMDIPEPNGWAHDQQQQRRAEHARDGQYAPVDAFGQYGEQTHYTSHLGYGVGAQTNEYAVDGAVAYAPRGAENNGSGIHAGVANTAQRTMSHHNAFASPSGGVFGYSAPQLGSNIGQSHQNHPFAPSRYQPMGSSSLPNTYPHAPQNHPGAHLHIATQNLQQNGAYGSINPAHLSFPTMPGSAAMPGPGPHSGADSMPESPAVGSPLRAVSYSPSHFPGSGLPFEATGYSGGVDDAGAGPSKARRSSDTVARGRRSLDGAHMGHYGDERPGSASHPHAHASSRAHPYGKRNADTSDLAMIKQELDLLAETEREVAELKNNLPQHDRKERRKMQNRLAQRAFRARSKVHHQEVSKHINDLEDLAEDQTEKVEQMSLLIARLQRENELLRRATDWSALGLADETPGLESPPSGSAPGPRHRGARGISMEGDE